MYLQFDNLQQDKENSSVKEINFGVFGKQQEQTTLFIQIIQLFSLFYSHVCALPNFFFLHQSTILFLFLIAKRYIYILLSHLNFSNPVFQLRVICFVSKWTYFLARQIWVSNSHGIGKTRVTDLSCYVIIFTGLQKVSSYRLDSASNLFILISTVILLNVC